MCVWARFVCDVSHFGSNNKRKCDFWVQKIRKKRKNLKENTRESVANNTRTENLPTPAAAASGTGSGKKKVNKQINSQRAKECRRSVDLLKLEVCSGGEYYISNYDYIVFFAQPLFAKCAFFAQQRNSFIIFSHFVDYSFVIVRASISHPRPISTRISTELKRWVLKRIDIISYNRKTSRSPDKLLLLVFFFLAKH